MAQFYFKTYINILTIFIFAKLCVFQEVEDLQIGTENIHALIAVFHTPNRASLTDDFVYDYQCPGILIHPKAALVLSYCWSRPSQTLDAVVRSYNWIDPNKITKETPYEERSVIEILNFVSYDSQQSTASHLNIVVLTSPFDIGSSINYISYSSYSKREKPHRNECFAVHIEGNITKGLTTKKFPIWPTDLVACCMNWQPTLLTSNDFASDLNKCVSKLNSLDCFEYLNTVTCKNLDSMGAPVFCQKKESPGEYYLHGFVADRKKCKFVITNVEKQKWWIRRELDMITFNNYDPNNLYKLMT